VPVLVIGSLLAIQSCNGDDDDDGEPKCTKEVAESKLTSPNQIRLTSDSLLIVQYLADNEIDIADNGNQKQGTLPDY
jgi:hypothetical protein